MIKPSNANPFWADLILPDGIFKRLFKQSIEKPDKVYKKKTILCTSRRCLYFFPAQSKPVCVFSPVQAKKRPNAVG